MENGVSVQNRAGHASSRKLNMYVNRKGCSNGLLTDHCRLPLGQRLIPESTGKAGQGIPGRCFSSRRSKSTMQKGQQKVVRKPG